MSVSPSAAHDTVCAVVVTYNRRDLLDASLKALAAQTRLPDRILVVDNNSTDGTREFLAAEHPDVDVLALEENRGGAGGFHAGLQAAHADGATWIWLLDDDTIARPDALAELLGARGPDAGSGPPLLLSSRAVWSDGTLHPMNLQYFKVDVEEYVDSALRGLVPIRAATFVSLLVHRSAVDRFGLPLAHYFLWADDLEYTARITKGAPVGYVVTSSEVEHRTKTPYVAVGTTGARFYFHVRNGVYMLRGSSWTPREKVSLIWSLIFTTREYLATNRYRRYNVRIVLRGLRDGVRAAPVG